MISMVLFAESRHFWTHSYDPGTEDRSAGVEVRSIDPNSNIRRFRYPACVKERLVSLSQPNGSHNDPKRFHLRMFNTSFCLFIHMASLWLPILDDWSDTSLGRIGSGRWDSQLSKRWSRCCASSTVLAAEFCGR